MNGQNVGYWVYCVEGRRGATPSNGSWIWRGTVSDWDSYGSRSEPTNLLVGSSDDAQSRREKINWIVHNSYPHKSPAEMGFSGVSRDDLIAATSAAIWAQSDDADISGLDRGAQDVFDYLTENVQRLPLKSGEIGGLIVESSGQDVVVVPERDAPKPKLRTVASFSENSVVKTLPGRASNYMYDTVYIENIYPGYEYRLDATMHRKDAAGNLEEEGHGHTEFYPENSEIFLDRVDNPDGSVSGRVVVKIDDADDIKPGEVGVVYEVLTARGIRADGMPQTGKHTIAKHEDPNDQDQTVKPHSTGEPVPPTSTTAKTTPTEGSSTSTVTQTTTPTTTVTADTTTVLVTPTTTVTAPATVTTAPGTTVVEDGPSTTTTAPGTTVVEDGPSTTTTAPGTTVVEDGPSTTTTAPGTTHVEPGPSTTTTAPGTTVVEDGPSTTTTAPGTTVVEDGPSTTTTAPGTTVTSTAPTVTVTETPTTTATVPNQTVTTTVTQGFNPNPDIRTVAEFEDGVNVVQNGTTVVDTVYYSGLVAGKTYTLDAKLVDKQDENNVLGTGAVTFVVPGTEGELANGNVKVEIAVTNAPNPVQAAVAFERLTSKEVNAAGEETDGKKANPIAEHEDIADEDQTVRTVFEPSIATNAKFENGSTAVVAGNTVIDTVDYKGLVPGKEYTLSAKLMERIGEKAPYQEGKVLGEGTVTFTPETTDGSVDVEIKVNDDVTKPVNAAVAFEELTSTEVEKTGQDNPQGGDTPETSDDNKIAEHKDIDDANQTVGVPHITTNANFEKGSSEVTNGAVVVDTVSYSGLVPGKEYTLTAQLIDKADGKTVLGTGTKTFTPKEANGSVDVEITVDNAPKDRVVTAAVAFEELTSTVVDRGGNENPKGGDTPETSDDNPIADHKEIDDEDQTVRNPKISTNANFANGAQEVKNGVAVIDTVTYEGLVPGKVYTLTADLINKEDGKTVLGSGNKTFIPTEPNGSEDVTIVVTNAPVDETVTAAVAFEELTSTQVDRAGKDNPKGGDTPETSDDNEIAEHKDLKDKDQTVESKETPKTSEQPTPETSPATPTSEEPVPTTTIPLLPPTSPETPTTDVCKPVTSTSTVPGTTEPGTTEPGTTVPGTTNPDTTEPGTTVPGTTVPGTTVEETTTEVVTTPEDCGTTESTPTDSEETTTEPTEPTATEPATSEKTTEPTKPTKPTSTTPVVPPVVWFPNPQIGTTADFANGAKEVVSGVVVNDTVKYQGLVPGKTYTLNAELVSKDAFNNLADKNVYGEAVIGTGTKTFTASETGNGSEVVEITVNEGIDTPVRAAVAFETLTSTEVDENGQDNPKGGDTPNDLTDDNPIAEHKNINDQNQTVRSPKTPDTPPVFEEEPYIGTNADFATGSKQVVAGATIVDSVRYAGLVPGKTYTLTADLVAKHNGAIIGQGEKQFTASEDGFGVENVDITVASWVNEPIYAAVAFERLTSTEVDAKGEDLPEGNRVPEKIAQHRDIQDAAQTVVSPNVDRGNVPSMEPGVSTNADFANGGVVENGATVRDVVNYWGLVPGKTYTATAKLVERVGEKAPYSEGRVLGTKSVTFTAEASSGTITVDIPVTNAETPVVAAVAYETITSTEVDRSGKDNPKGGDTPNDYSDDNPIAEHEDINDSFQTVTSEGGTPTTPAETTTEETTPAETTTEETTPAETTPAETSTEETTPAPVPSETTSTTTTPGSDGGDSPDEGSSVDRDKLWWLLLIPGLGMIPALLGGGGSSTPAPKPAPKPVPSKPAPAPAPSTSTVHTPKPAGKPVPADSPRGEIKQIPSGGTALDADMPAYI
ncbi:VaFE repeat-containing surface-anchored protein [Corynebacterium sp. zg-917]|uniref:VaFE repeat-containing surface-anchored protein n=1 Tax=Corynebacterium lujinxingii TaxID=2763010 RepID=A0ABR6UJW1_9CORY|nr:VaFE repeat-containing surface-anchored protein [Corynebacterium lujinxingii]